MSVREGFSTHRDRFRDQWRRLWSLDSEQRSAVLESVRQFRAAGSRAGQEDVLRRLEREVDAPREDLVSALGVLDYLAHLAARGSAPPESTIEELRALGFLPDEGRGEAEALLRRFLSGPIDRREAP